MKNFKKRRNDYDSYDDSYDNGFYRGDEDEEDGVVGGDAEDESMPSVPAKKPAAGSSSHFKVIKPRGYQDGPAIADQLVDGYTVVLNIEEIDRQSALRLIDFLLGALQVLGGGFRRVTKTTLVLSPHSDDLAEEDTEEEGELV